MAGASEFSGRGTWGLTGGARARPAVGPRSAVPAAAERGRREAGRRGLLQEQGGPSCTEGMERGSFRWGVGLSLQALRLSPGLGTGEKANVDLEAAGLREASAEPWEGG